MIGHTLESQEQVSPAEIKFYVLMLAPFAPHITEELWSRMGEPYSIHQQSFPQAHPALLAPAQVTIAVQINGRTRTTIELAPDAPQEHAIALTSCSKNTGALRSRSYSEVSLGVLCSNQTALGHQC